MPALTSIELNLGGATAFGDISALDFTGSAGLVSVELWLNDSTFTSIVPINELLTEV